jgi:hypothetical protein
MLAILGLSLAVFTVGDIVAKKGSPSWGIVLMNLALAGLLVLLVLDRIERRNRFPGL